mgnify:CR=1 FL=1
MIQFAPGGPVEQTIAQIQGISVDATARITGGGSSDSLASSPDQKASLSKGNMDSVYRGARGLDPEVIKEIEKDFGFDKPVHVRFFDMIKNYIFFDFGFFDNGLPLLVVALYPPSTSLIFSSRDSSEF